MYEINSTPYNLVEGGIECVEENPCLQAIQGKYLICRLLLPVHHPEAFYALTKADMDPPN